METSTATRKTTTLADLMAAAKVGAIDPNLEVIAAADVQDNLRRAYEAGAGDADRLAANNAAANAPRVPLSTNEHDCAIPGCKHGDAHAGPSQPDRQVKLECPNCHAVARMTHRAIGRTGGNGIVCGGDGGTFAVAQRRSYGRKAAA